MEEKNVNVEQLALISQMINTAKGQIKKGAATRFLIWGYTICICCILNYVLLQIPGVGTKAFAVWWLVLVGFGASVWDKRRKRLNKTHKSYLDDVVGDLWTAFAISMVILGVNSYYLQLFTYPMLMMLYAIGLYVSGSIYKFKPLKIGGVICWACTLVAFHVSFENQLLVLAFSLIAGYIIPGHLLQKQSAHV